MANSDVVAALRSLKRSALRHPHLFILIHEALVIRNVKKLPLNYMTP